jgi:predicted lipoprotein with Yx(FWY)xxD motif
MSIRIALGAAGAIVLALTACSSSKTSNGAGNTPPASSSSSSSSTSSTAAASGSAISLSGGVLVAANGRTLYFNTVDTATSIQCSGGCAAAWPPLMGTVTAGSGLAQADFAVATRPDGTKQVTYFGHPIYFFAQDTAAGDKKGDGLADGGGKWYATTPKQADELKPGGGSASSSSSSSPGYTY